MSLVIVATMSNTSKISTKVQTFIFFHLDFSLFYLFLKRESTLSFLTKDIPFRQTRNIKSLDFKQKLCEDLDDGS